MSQQPEASIVTPEPARARAVFSSGDFALLSSGDFALLRTAALHHLRTHQDDPDSVKYGNLYHRLGRLA